ncbi:MAG TPA: aminotransferase class I/II-fold pyridoxal phosphate-dependent enzyme [Planctomycetota bacterium]|nr:aminotransferase class I/II-fold pyridoxal phosphate-dependent enzyme [Planctomycetota bacterium]
MGFLPLPVSLLLDSIPVRTRTSRKASLFRESVIREMTRLVNANKGGGVNLAQGFPDFACPRELKEAACAAVQADVNQYAITWGAKDLRNAISKKFARWFGFETDPEREITVCCGATETMISAFLAVVDPGDEVVVFEPFYENYGPDAILSGAVPRFVRLSPPDFTIDWDALRAAFTPRTKAIVINTPNNPTGKVFTRQELEGIAKLCREHDVLAITDEIYEHIVYDGAEHVCLATLPGMRERTITINALSKTYSVTGWRIGWAIAPPEITNAIRKVHDFLTVGAPAPLQRGAVAALEMPDSYYRSLGAEYQARRDFLLAGLDKAGFKSVKPRGAYYIMSDFSPFGFDGDDQAFARYLIKEIGVAGVPGSSFFSNPKDGEKLIRFCFPKKQETLAEAVRRLEKLRR